MTGSDGRVGGGGGGGTYGVAGAAAPQNGVRFQSALTSKLWLRYGTEILSDSLCNVMSVMPL
jgi:hypothetical protein